VPTPAHSCVSCAQEGKPPLHHAAADADPDADTIAFLMGNGGEKSTDAFADNPIF